MAGVIGPLIAGHVYDAFDDYRYAFFTAATLLVVALTSISVARPPQRAPA